MRTRLSPSSSHLGHARPFKQRGASRLRRAAPTCGATAGPTSVAHDSASTRAEGLEPSSSLEHRRLKPARLPFHHAREHPQSRQQGRRSGTSSMVDLRGDPVLGGEGDRVYALIVVRRVDALTAVQDAALRRAPSSARSVSEPSPPIMLSLPGATSLCLVVPSERIVATASVDEVVAAVTLDRVGAVTADELVVPRSAAQRVARVARAEHQPSGYCCPVPDPPRPLGRWARRGRSPLLRGAGTAPSELGVGREGDPVRAEADRVRAVAARHDGGDPWCRRA